MEIDTKTLTSELRALSYCQSAGAESFTPDCFQTAKVSITTHDDHIEVSVTPTGIWARQLTVGSFEVKLDRPESVYTEERELQFATDKPSEHTKHYLDPQRQSYNLLLFTLHQILSGDLRAHIVTKAKVHA